MQVPSNSVLRQMILLKNIFYCIWVGVLPALNVCPVPVGVNKEC